jgi:hypothetical protein
MEDQLTAALIARLNPFLYIIGLLVVLGVVSFGGTIISLWWKAKEKKDDSISRAIGENTIAIARVESKLDLLAQRYDKDLNALGSKIRRLEV